MRTDERQMPHHQESDGIVLAEPSQGLGYQLAGGLQRLGRRIVGLLPEGSDPARIKHVPMQLSSVASLKGPFTTLVLSPEAELGRNASPDLTTLQRFEDLIEKARQIQPDLDVVLILPQASHKIVIDKVQKLKNKDMTVFWVPAVFGFRDQGLMDQALRLFNKNPTLLMKQDTQLESREDIPLLYVGDLVAFIISLPQSALAPGKFISVPPTTSCLKAWRESFLKAFQPRPTWKEKFFSVLETERLGRGLLSPSTLSAGDENAVLATDVFPTALTKLDTALKHLALVHKQNREMELVFPPSRGA